MGKIGETRLKETSNISRGALRKKIHFKGEMIGDVSFYGKKIESESFCVKNYDKCIRNKLDETI